MKNIENQPQIQLRIAKLKCNFGIMESLGTVIIWIILTIVTIGFAQ